MNEEKKGNDISTSELNRSEQRYVSIDDRNKNDGEVSSTKTEVKDANASGVGALGRNDEKLTEAGSDAAGEASDY